MLGLHLGRVPERLDGLLAVIDRPAPTHDHGAEQITVALGRYERQRWGDLPGEKRPELFGRVLDHGVVAPHDGSSIVDLEEHRPAVDGVDRVQPQLECGDHPEVPASTPQRPEQIFVHVLVGSEDLTIGGDYLGSHDVVAGQAATSAEIPDPTAEGQAGHPSGRDDPAGGGQPVGMGGVVEVAPGRPTTGPGCLLGRVHEHVIHQRQVDHHAAVAGAESRHAVTATPHRHIKAVVPRMVDRGDHVSCRHSPHDDRWTPIVHEVVDPPVLVVVALARLDYWATNPCT